MLYSGGVEPASLPSRPTPPAPVWVTSLKALRRSLALPPITSVFAPKAVGHLLGAAGAVEAILGLQALRQGTLPRSINSDPLDPEVELAVTSEEAIDLSDTGSERLMLKNAFGFGGHNISLVLSAPGNTAEQQC